MADQYNRFMAQLDNPELAHYERQSLEAGLLMLKEFMSYKNQDIRRQLQEY